jgi:hypothetical protein
MSRFTAEVHYFSFCCGIYRSCISGVESFRPRIFTSRLRGAASGRSLSNVAQVG